MKNIMEKDTNIVGTITELKCITHFLELGCTVSVPQNPARYDFIVDTGNRLLKVQVKTSNSTRNVGCLTFCTASSHYIGGKHVHTDYQDDGIDFFCTYFEGECYLVPVDECGKSQKSLRFEPTKNGQVKGISFAKDYIAKEVISKQ